jgi:hypothetical protein
MIHPPGCTCTTSYGCQLRRKGIQVPASATPTRTPRFVQRRPRYNSWEAGVAGEHRRDGSFMPYIHSDGREIGVKEWSDNRRDYSSKLRASKAGVA